MMIDIFFLGVGLIVGSFLNVVFMRTEREESYVGGRSHCDACEKTLSWCDNIPVLSYLILRGKCRFCKEVIPRQHLWFELGTGGIFFFLGKVFFRVDNPETWLLTLFLGVLISFFVLIVASDIASMEIPLVFLVGINIATALYIVLNFFFFERQLPFLETALWTSLLGGFCAWLFFFGLVYFSQETWMGWGDVWIALAGGTVVGIKYVLLMLTLSFAVGALFGISLLFWKSKKLTTQVPFAPFLVFGIVIILLAKELTPQFLGYFIW
ncbi:MAG: prepilin peptidase [Candidatus Moranbacteria bacterium]|nr:prepilin peptidase [Candidatus Moranbacteria bacterium]